MFKSEKEESFYKLVRRKRLALLCVLSGLALLFTGCLWQIEITIINDLNGWTFTWIFCSLVLNNWVARDLFYLILFLCYLFTVATAYWMGKFDGNE